MTSVHLVKGGDEILVSDALTSLIDELVGDDDRTLLVDEVVFDDKSEQIGPLIDAASTPPFLTDRRIVVGRGVQHFSRQDDVAPLVRYLESPLDTTTLVLEWSGGRLPKTLGEAIKTAGGKEVDASPGRKTGEWVDAQLKASSLTLSAPAKRRLTDWLGENVNRLPALLATLETSLGPGASVGPDELEGFLGVEEGGVPPWDLTDAIANGDIAGSLDALHRMLGGGGRHPLQIMATLTSHFGQVLALDSSELATDQQAAEFLGMKGLSFPAKKARTQARSLGHDRVVDAIALLAGADLDLRGQRDLPDEVTLEVLVARLARLAR